MPAILVRPGGPPWTILARSGRVALGTCEPSCCGGSPGSCPEYLTLEPCDYGLAIGVCGYFPELPGTICADAQVVGQSRRVGIGDVVRVDGRCYTVSGPLRPAGIPNEGGIFVGPGVPVELAPTQDCDDAACARPGEWLQVMPCSAYSGPPVYICDRAVPGCVYFPRTVDGVNTCWLADPRAPRVAIDALPSNAIVLPEGVIALSGRYASCCECLARGNTTELCIHWYATDCDDVVRESCCCGTVLDRTRARFRILRAWHRSDEFQDGAILRTRTFEVLNPDESSLPSGELSFATPYTLRMRETTIDYPPLIPRTETSTDDYFFELIDCAYPQAHGGSFRGLFGGRCASRFFADVPGIVVRSSTTQVGCGGVQVYTTIDLLESADPSSPVVIRDRIEWAIQTIRQPKSYPCQGDCATLGGIGRYPKIPLRPMLPGSRIPTPVEVEPEPTGFVDLRDLLRLPSGGGA